MAPQFSIAVARKPIYGAVPALQPERSFPLQRAAAVAVGFCLAAATVVAALAAVSTDASPSESFSCSLAAAVCAVATVHYFAIWNAFGAKGLSPLQRENTVDQLRYSDWFVTLPLLALDFGGMREAIASGGGPAAPEASKYVLALLMAGVVLLGAVWRVWASELRGVLAKGAIGALRVGGGIVGFLGSCACFVLVVYFLLHELDASALSGEALEDALALQAFVIAWIGYPVVALLQALPGLGAESDDYGAFLSQAKAVVYALLDGFSKVGVAFYASQKIHRVY